MPFKVTKNKPRHAHPYLIAHFSLYRADTPTSPRGHFQGVVAIFLFKRSIGRSQNYQRRRSITDLVIRRSLGSPAFQRIQVPGVDRDMAPPTTIWRSTPPSFLVLYWHGEGRNRALSMGCLLIDTSLLTNLRRWIPSTPTTPCFMPRLLPSPGWSSFPPCASLKVEVLWS